MKTKAIKRLIDLVIEHSEEPLRLDIWMELGPDYTRRLRRAAENARTELQQIRLVSAIQQESKP